MEILWWIIIIALIGGGVLLVVTRRRGPSRDEKLKAEIEGIAKDAEQEFLRSRNR